MSSRAGNEGRPLPDRGEIGGRSRGDHAENKRSFKKDWRGSWGPLADRRSRLSRQAKEYERKMLAKYRPATEDDRDMVREAAEVRALAKMMRHKVGTDPKVSFTAAVRAQKAVGVILGPLRHAGKANGHKPDLARQIQAARREHSHADR
jgi:hypothetical protein